MLDSYTDEIRVQHVRDHLSALFARWAIRDEPSPMLDLLLDRKDSVVLGNLELEEALGSIIQAPKPAIDAVKGGVLSEIAMRPLFRFPPAPPDGVVPETALYLFGPATEWTAVTDAVVSVYHGNLADLVFGIGVPDVPTCLPPPDDHVPNKGPACFQIGTTGARVEWDLFNATDHDAVVRLALEKALTLSAIGDSVDVAYTVYLLIEAGLLVRSTRNLLNQEWIPLQNANLNPVPQWHPKVALGTEAGPYHWVQYWEQAARLYDHWGYRCALTVVNSDDDRRHATLGTLALMLKDLVPDIAQMTPDGFNEYGFDHIYVDLADSYHPQGTALIGNVSICEKQFP